MSGEAGADHFSTDEPARAADVDPAHLLAGTSMAMLVKVLRALPAAAEARDAVSIFNGSSGRFVTATVEDVEAERDRLRASGRRDDDETCSGLEAPTRGDGCDGFVSVAMRRRDIPTIAAVGPAPAPQARVDSEPPVFSSRERLLLSLRGRVEGSHVEGACDGHRKRRKGEGGGIVGQVPESGRVQAEGAQSSFPTAREGPGDPPTPSVTAAPTTSSPTLVAAVAGGGVAALLTKREIAREAPGAERGKAAFGPPGGAAAPPEDSSTAMWNPRGREHRDTSLDKPPSESGVRPLTRRDLLSSLVAPPNPGARPGDQGDALFAENGKPPPREFCEEEGWQWRNPR